MGVGAGTEGGDCRVDCVEGCVFSWFALLSCDDVEVGVVEMGGVEGQTRAERITGKHNFTFSSFPLLYEEQFFNSIISLTRDLEG